LLRRPIRRVDRVEQDARRGLRAVRVVVVVGHVVAGRGDLAEHRAGLERLARSDRHVVDRAEAVGQRKDKAARVRALVERHCDYSSVVDERTEASLRGLVLLCLLASRLVDARCERALVRGALALGRRGVERRPLVEIGLLLEQLLADLFERRVGTNKARRPVLEARGLAALLDTRGMRERTLDRFERQLAFRRALEQRRSRGGGELALEQLLGQRADDDEARLLRGRGLLRRLLLVGLALLLGSCGVALRALLGRGLEVLERVGQRADLVGEPGLHGLRAVV